MNWNIGAKKRSVSSFHGCLENGGRTFIWILCDSFFYSSCQVRAGDMWDTSWRVAQAWLRMTLLKEDRDRWICYCTAEFILKCAPTCSWSHSTRIMEWTVGKVYSNFVIFIGLEKIIDLPRVTQHGGGVWQGRKESRLTLGWNIFTKPFWDSPKTPMVRCFSGVPDQGTIHAWMKLAKDGSGCICPRPMS
jgi:hypothetical protein